MDPVLQRTSVRSWTDQPVEEEKILAILKAAMQAPSAMNSQPWEFTVITDQKVKEQLSEISPYSHFAAKAPVILALNCRKENSCPVYNQIDMGICIENVLIEAEIQGLGAVCLGVAPLEERMNEMKKILSLSDDLDAFALIPIGYASRKQQPRDRYDPSRISWIR